MAVAVQSSTKVGCDGIASVGLSYGRGVLSAETNTSIRMRAVLW